MATVNFTFFFKESFSELKDYKIVAKQCVKFQRDYYYYCYYFSFLGRLEKRQRFQHIFQTTFFFFLNPKSILSLRMGI